MVTGRLPFSGDSVTDTVGAVLHKEPEWDGVPAGVQPLLQRCLEKDPDRRLQSMAESAGVARPAALASSPRARRAGWLAAAAALFAAAAAAVSIVHFSERQRALNPVRFQIPAPSQSMFDGYFAVSPDGRQVAFAAADPRGREASGSIRSIRDVSSADVRRGHQHQFVHLVRR